jgi:SAM-dependent methyltransferase
LLKGDIERLPFKNGCFDAVISVGVLQYLKRDDQCLGEYGRVVRKGGIVVVTMPNLLRLFNFTDPYYYFSRGWKYVASKFNKRMIETHPPDSRDLSSNEFFRNRRYLYGEWRKILDKEGLKEKEVISIGFGPPTFWGKEILHHQRSIGVSDSLENISRRRGAGPLKAFANRWVILLEKTC